MLAKTVLEVGHREIRWGSNPNTHRALYGFSLTKLITFFTSKYPDQLFPRCFRTSLWLGGRQTPFGV